MTANCTLAKDDERACEDVGAFDGDRHRNHLVIAAQIVARPQLDALAAMHVHRIVGDLPAHLGDVVLEHRGGHRRLLAAIDGTGGNRTRRVHRVRIAHHTREDGFDAFEFAHRHVELTADARVRAGRKHTGLGATGRVGRQRNATADRQLLDQHAPALACHLDPADDHIERHEYIFARQRAILKRHVEREMAAADIEAGRVARNQRASDAVVHLVAA